MIDEAFEWDDDKAASNRRKHRVTFEMARDVFDDAFSIDWADVSEAYGEERLMVLGMAGERLLVVAYTMRGERIRIISARPAETAERRLYHGENKA